MYVRRPYSFQNVEKLFVVCFLINFIKGGSLFVIYVWCMSLIFPDVIGRIRIQFSLSGRTVLQEHCAGTLEYEAGRINMHKIGKI